MAKQQEWREDTEVQGLAIQVQERFPDELSHIDIGMLRFARFTNTKTSKAMEIKANSLPIKIDCPYAYYLITNEYAWKQLNDNQKTLKVYEALYQIAEGGCDETSENYTALKKPDVRGHSIVLARAGNDWGWDEPGRLGTPNILAESDNEEDYDDSIDDYDN